MRNRRHERDIAHAKSVEEVREIEKNKSPWMAVAECPPHEEANDCFRRHHGLKTHVDIVLLIPLREFRHDFSPPVFRIAIPGIRFEFRQARE